MFFLNNYYICKMIQRSITSELIDLLDFFPAIGIIGPRQCGKTTLVKQLMKIIDKPTIYIDLESHSDIIKLTEPEHFFLNNMDKCIIIDEIQHMPELFPLLRSVIDVKRIPSRFIILGSASPTIMRDSSESLAGRIAYKELSPFNLIEASKQQSNINKHWFRGGFPDSYLAKTDKNSYRWKDNFITTYIERDLPQLGLDLSSISIRKLWMMLASDSGNLFNAASYSKSLGMSVYTVKKYVDFLEKAFLIHSLPPFSLNTNKRLVKSPKIYIRDSGISHFLNSINSFEQLEGNIKIGASWEAYVVEQIKQSINDSNYQLYFYRTHNGTECDLLIARGIDVVAAIEIKYTNAPKITKGFTISLQDLKPDQSFVITHSSDDYIIKNDIRVCSLWDFLNKYLKGIIGSSF